MPDGGARHNSSLPPAAPAVEEEVEEEGMNNSFSSCCRSAVSPSLRALVSTRAVAFSSLRHSTLELVPPPAEAAEETARERTRLSLPGPTILASTLARRTASCPRTSSCEAVVMVVVVSGVLVLCVRVEALRQPSLSKFGR